MKKETSPASSVAVEEGKQTPVSGPMAQFVFLDERPWPYMVGQREGGQWWLHYWADSYHNFATLRPLTESEVEKFRPLAMPQKSADFYLRFNEKRHLSGHAPKSENATRVSQ